MLARTAAPLALAGLLALASSTGTASAGEFAAELMGGYFAMSSSKSAEAVFDSSGGFTWGAAGRYSFKRGIFVTAGVRTFSKEGERVFVAGPTDTVARLGFPLSIRITPVFVTAGYRFRDGKMIVPYAGIGGSLTSFSEESSVQGVSYDESRTKAGFHVVGGAEVGRGRFRFGAEVGWSTVPDAVGVDGVSAVYNESNLGGWSVVGKLVIAFGGKKGPEDVEDDPLDTDEPDEDLPTDEGEPDEEPPADDKG
jgi:hypothetical protein